MCVCVCVLYIYIYIYTFLSIYSGRIDVPVHQNGDVRIFTVVLIFILWLCWVFVAALVFPPVAVSRGCSLVLVCGLLTVVASLAAELGLWGSSSCG